MIYLDYAATTPVDPAVLKKMLPFFSKQFANPASVHSAGQAALKAVDDARYRIAELLNVKGPEIIFCSGSTEANNLALRGLAEASGDLKKLHIVTTPVEHSSILEPLRYLESRGVKVTYVPVDSRGLVKPEAIIAAVRSETFLVSVGAVNSETGAIQPLKKIGRLLRKHNELQRKNWLNTSPRKRGPEPQPVYLHSDATQAPNFIDCRPDQLQVDLMSLSAHKIYGPKGIGLLYLRSGLKPLPLSLGGHQERNIRSGTVNVPGVIGLASALELACKNRLKHSASVSRQRERLSNGLKKYFPRLRINNDFSSSVPSHLNISFPGYEGDALLAALDERGVAVSTGSACASGDITVSHVLSAMGIDQDRARGALRLSLGKTTSAREIDSVLKIMRLAIKS